MTFISVNTLYSPLVEKNYFLPTYILISDAKKWCAPLPRFSDSDEVANLKTGGGSPKN